MRSTILSESQLGAVRIDDYKFRFCRSAYRVQGGKVTLNWPSIVNFAHIDPFERGYAQPTALYNFSPMSFGICICTEKFQCIS